MFSASNPRYEDVSKHEPIIVASRARSLLVTWLQLTIIIASLPQQKVNDQAGSTTPPSGKHIISVSGPDHDTNLSPKVTKICVYENPKCEVVPSTRR